MQSLTLSEIISSIPTWKQAEEILATRKKHTLENLKLKGDYRISGYIGRVQTLESLCADYIVQTFDDEVFAEIFDALQDLRKKYIAEETTDVELILLDTALKEYQRALKIYSKRYGDHVIETTDTLYQTYMKTKELVTGRLN